ncbi:PTS sugar transporter subunit IIA [Rummeliibacillus stabekisii]|uniref:PTS sugar transporter subunit IIA n=1 Tax=Rummeliibacillus stabekisii TaxID=241244 RepID=UPI00116BCB10|nr:PTS glucose transporter subunit IIA [Rummeliibacillus stabekisii]MBB5169094.1 glucose-specific phosphotransferase system IIA component [Rummeliibacillus stabekisii]GEL06444.1 hypothetical protein RST01_30710 [Rummeliibacillus stabekisii]
MFKGFFKKDTIEDPSLTMPLEGRIIPIEEVPDPVFSQKMMGDGFAIVPTNSTVVSPVNGKVISVFPTKHAINLLDDQGREILLHIGLETVSLNGLGFTPFVKDGQKVKKGDRLMDVDFDTIKKKVPSIISSVVFTNLSDDEKVAITKHGVEIKKK